MELVGFLVLVIILGYGILSTKHEEELSKKQSEINHLKDAPKIEFMLQLKAMDIFYGNNHISLENPYSDRQPMYGQVFNETGELLYEDKLSNEQAFLGFFSDSSPVTLKILDNLRRPFIEKKLSLKLLDGEAKLYNLDGDLFYEGNLEGGIPSGQGIFYEEDNSILYKGNFESGLPKGFGELYFGNKLVYQGKMEDGFPIYI